MTLRGVILAVATGAVLAAGAVAGALVASEPEPGSAAPASTTQSPASSAATRTSVRVVKVLLPAPSTSPAPLPTATAPTEPETTLPVEAATTSTEPATTTTATPRPRATNPPAPVSAPAPTTAPTLPIVVPTSTAPPTTSPPTTSPTTTPPTVIPVPPQLAPPPGGWKKVDPRIPALLVEGISVQIVIGYDGASPEERAANAEAASAILPAARHGGAGLVVTDSASVDLRQLEADPLVRSVEINRVMWPA